MARITLEFPDKILCPLCLKAFSEDAIETEPPDLTEELAEIVTVSMVRNLTHT